MNSIERATDEISRPIAEVCMLLPLGLGIPIFKNGDNLPYPRVQPER